MKLPKLVITDIDGVWTDGGMYYDQNGNELKKFNTSDSAGVLFLHLLDIPVAIISGEDTQIVKNRASKLKIDHVFLGIKNKVDTANALLAKLNISWDEVAYIGDDINDMLIIEKCGYSASPKNAPEYIKRMTDYTTELRGGEGAFRSFVEHILNENNLFDKVITLYKNSIT